MLFFLSVLAFIALLFMLVFYKRTAVLPRLTSFLPPRFAQYVPVPQSFEDQAAAGFSSAAFDLEGNLAGDSRVGLDERGVAEVRDIMRREGVNFDQARLIRHHRMLAAHGIDPSGMPLDSKAVTRL